MKKESNMKKLTFILMVCVSCLLFSCHNDEPMEGNPEVDIERHIFGREGGSIEVHSQKGYAIWLNYDESLDTGSNPPKVSGSGIKGDWYKAVYKYRDGDVHQSRILIEVEANDTGKERVVPIRITSGNYQCNTEYRQEK